MSYLRSIKNRLFYLRFNMSWSTWDSEESRRNKFFPVEILHDQEKYVVANVADEADANLIAAAPDLLAACEACMTLLIRYENRSIAPEVGTGAAINAAHAAIAKARGER
jgi:hypothetical protein